MKRTILIALSLVALASAARAEDPPCKLQQIAVVDMRTDQSGLVSVPVKVNGIPGRWLVDTGNVKSMIGATFVGRYGLKRSSSREMGMMMGGVPITDRAEVDTIQFAGMTAAQYQLSVAPEPLLSGDTDGMLAPDIMRNYDIDFDFAAGQMHVLLPDHCPGQVVYWTSTGYARVPITLDQFGHITIPVVLDGHELTAVVDTGAQESTISLPLVRRLLGISADDPALRKLGSLRVNGIAQTQSYRYPFKSLTFEGVQISNPSITILQDTGLGHAAPDLLIGIETLRQLHMYIAYKEGMLYLTGAEAR